MDMVSKDLLQLHWLKTSFWKEVALKDWDELPGDSRFN